MMVFTARRNTKGRRFCSFVLRLTMATTSASEASAMLHVNADPQDTTSIPRDAATNDPVRRSKRQRRIVSATAAATFQTEQEPAPSPSPSPPPLQKYIHCDDGVSLRLIDFFALKKGLDHLCCHECSEKKIESLIDERIFSFFEFHNRKLAEARLGKRKHPNLEDSYKLFKRNAEKC
jgi:hypothetical protein